jgi:hypothetical protein
MTFIKPTKKLTRIDVAILRIIKDTLEKQNKYTCGDSGVNGIY